jgi:uncharacterized membrane protein YbhN (UPF0104 family)
MVLKKMEIKKLLKIIFAFIVSLSILFFFRKNILSLFDLINFSELHWVLLILAIIAYSSLFFIRGYRFSLFFKEYRKLYVMMIYNIAQFLSTILPLRLGDLYLFKLKSKENSKKKIFGAYLFLKILDLISVTIIFFGVSLIFLSLFNPVILITFYFGILFLVAEFLFIFINKFIKIGKIERIFIKVIGNKKPIEKIGRKKLYKLWILTNINWIIANIYAILFIKSLNINIYTLAQLIFSNTAMIFSGMIPLPTIAGYGVAEGVWSFFSILSGISDFSLTFSIAFMMHNFALLIGLIIFIISVIINRKL